MKKLMLAMLLMSSFGNAMDDDKATHMAAGIGIYVGCLVVGGIVDNLGYDSSYITGTTCLIPVAVIGAGKELYDSNHEGHEAEFADFAYTMAVPLAGSIVLYRF